VPQMATKKQAKRKPAKAQELPWALGLAYVWSRDDWDHREVDESRCRARVDTPEEQREGHYFHQCRLKAKHAEYGYGWCGRHLPSSALARRRRTDDLSAARHRVKTREELLGQAYDQAMLWGKGHVKAAAAAKAAYNRLERERAKLRRMEERRRT